MTKITPCLRKEICLKQVVTAFEHHVNHMGSLPHAVQIKPYLVMTVVPCVQVYSYTK